MTTWKTPGLWNDIPQGAKVRATRAEVKLVGEFVSLERHPSVSHAKIMRLKVAPFSNTIPLDSRDHWDVEYESKSQADVIRESPVGSVWVDRQDGWPRIVKVADEQITLQHNPHTFSESPIKVLPVSDIGSDPDVWIKVPLNLLREQAGV